MDKPEVNTKETGLSALNVISKVIQDIEKKVLTNTSKAKECEELNFLKEKCCDKKAIISSTAFHSITYLLKKGYLNGSQTISMLISLLPAVQHYGPMISTIGDIFLLDLEEQIKEKKTYVCSLSIKEHEHPLITVMNHNKEKTWFDIYGFVLKVLWKDDIKVEHKVNLLQPIFRNIFWTPNSGTSIQTNFFKALLMHSEDIEILNFTQELLLWKDIDVQYCLLLQEFLTILHKAKAKEIIVAWIPTLAFVIKWLIENGHDAAVWINLLIASINIDNSANSVVLYLLSEVTTDTPSSTIYSLAQVCNSIIFSTNCNKYVAYKFVAAALNWFLNPSPLAHSLYKILEDTIKYLHTDNLKWNDNVNKLVTNKYYKKFGSLHKEVKFCVDLILLTENWADNNKVICDWLINLKNSNKSEVWLNLHGFIYGIILCERESDCVSLCMEILLGTMEECKDLSFSLLCLIFYVLGKETDPNMQKMYLFILPKLAVKKDNIPLIINIIESLRKGNPKVFTPLVVQLYLLLWKLDNRTYSYLHNMLHDSNYEGSIWELNISKGIAVREICKVAPHHHGKDLVGVLSKILNESAEHKSGLPSAIAIEAVTELCKSYVIDVTGTWNAIQPKLRHDNRPQVIKSLCKFFGEIPGMNTPGHRNDRLNSDIIPMLWNFSFFNDPEIVRSSFQALSNFTVEDFPLKLFPEKYKVDIKIPKSQDTNNKPVEDIATLPYVPADCWVQFLEKINDDVLSNGGDLLIVVIERELNTLPRGLFYLPPEKSEPLSYSYLPSKSICRALVKQIMTHTPTSNYLPLFIIEIIRILGHEYSKLLPPLNWSFVERFLTLYDSCTTPCLMLLVKQGTVSKTARAVLEEFFKNTVWDSSKSSDIIFLYKKLHLLSRAVSYNILQNFLESTIDLFLQSALKESNNNFELILAELSKALNNTEIPPAHKMLMAKELEKYLDRIPPDHEVMRCFAQCATNFPVQIIESLTFAKDLSEKDLEKFHRRIMIRQAIGLRPDIKNPLVWLNDFIEAVAILQSEQTFLMETIWTLIRKRRDCNHTLWIQELIWRIQASITASNISETNKMTLSLLDVFVSATIVLSGHDIFFASENEFAVNKPKKLEMFPNALFVLLHFEQWSNLLPKVAQWFQKLVKWKQLPNNYFSAICKSLLNLKKDKAFADEKAWSYFFNNYSSSEE